MARTLRDAEVAFLLEPLPFVRGVRVLDPPTAEYDYLVLLDREVPAAFAQAHYRLVAGVGQECAARVWFVSDDPLSAPRALERAARISLDLGERELAARSVAAREQQLRADRGRQFGQLLAETVAWCVAPAAGAHRLRSPELRPQTLEWTDPRVEAKSADWWRLTKAGAEAREREIVTRREATQQIGELASKRAKLLRERGLSPEAPSMDLRGGRLLLFRTATPRDPVASHAAHWGTAEGDSAFLDACDLPPWDTWVSWEPWVQEAPGLVCWVPPDWLLRAGASCALRAPRIEWLRGEFLDPVQGPRGAAASVP